MLVSKIFTEPTIFDAKIFRTIERNKVKRAIELVSGIFKVVLLSRKNDLVISISPSVTSVLVPNRKLVCFFNDFQSFDKNIQISPIVRTYRRWIYWVMAKKSRNVVLISENSQKEFRTRYRRAQKTNVLLLSGEVEQQDTQKVFDYAVVAHSKHKRAELVLEAISTDPTLQTSKILLLAGPRQKELQSFVSRFHATLDVLVLGAVTDRQYEEKVGSARVLVIASIGEGFGLPAAQAIFRNQNLVTSLDAALLEVSKDYGIAADPLDKQSFSKALKTSLHASHSQSIYSRRTWREVQGDLENILTR